MQVSKFIFCKCIYYSCAFSHKGRESLSSACVNKREFAELRFIVFVPLCNCNIAAPMPNFEVSHVAENG